MPFIEIKVIEGAFTHEEKRQMVQRVSEAVIARSRASRCAPSPTTVITETPSGEWAIGGQSLTAEDVRAKRAAPAPA